MKTNKSASFNTIPVFTLKVLNEKLFLPKLRIVGLCGPEILNGNLKFSVGPDKRLQDNSPKAAGNETERDC